MSWPARLKPCENPACDHQTSLGSLFCCGPCDLANGKYDPEGYHTADCMQRHAERGPSTLLDRAVRDEAAQAAGRS